MASDSVPDEPQRPRSLVRAGASLYAIRTLGIPVGLGTTAALAFHFGTGRDIEAFFAASVFYFLAGKVIQTGAAGSVIVPEYLRAKKEDGQAAAWALASNVLNVTTLVSIVITVIAIAASPWLLPVAVPGFESDASDKVVDLFRIMAFGIITLPTIALTTAFLNADRRFGRPEAGGFVGAVINLSTILILAPTLGITAAALGMLISSYFNLIWLLWYLRKQGYRHRWIVNVRDPRLRAWGRGVRPYFGYMVVVQIQAVALTAILSTLAPGSMAVYRYASDLTAKISGFIAGPIGTISLPVLAEKAVSGIPADLRIALAKALRYSVLLALPVFLVVLISSRSIVEILLGRGGFSSLRVDSVSTTIAILAITILVGPILSVMQRGFVAIGRTGWLNIVAVLGQGYALALMFLLIPKFGYEGAAWHAVGATIAITATGAFALWKLGVTPDRSTLLAGAWRVAIVAGAALLVGWGVGEIDRVASWYSSWIRFATIGSAVTGVYLAGSWLLGVSEVTDRIRAILATLNLRNAGDAVSPMVHPASPNLQASGAGLGEPGRRDAR